MNSIANIVFYLYLPVMNRQIAIVALLLLGSALIIVVIINKQPKPTKINYQSQIDSLSGVISTQDQIIKSMVNDLDSLTELKTKVRILHGKKIIEYRTMETPLRIKQLAERL